MVKLENIEFGYSRKKRLFNNLNLELESGSIHGLLGKNGAGKTTLLKILIGLRTSYTGKSNVLNFDPKLRDASFLEQIYFVPEDLYLPSISISSFIWQYSGFYPLFNDSDLKSYLESFELEQNAHLGQLSYGQKKKFLLSFAMATGAKLVLFDEPTNGLDIPSKSIFRKLAASAINENRSFIISTHQVRDLNLLIDSVMLVDKGKILLNDSINNIAQTYSFVTLPRKHNLENALYYEEHLEGIKAIVPFQDDMETGVDLEMLFNALVFGKIFNTKSL
jgi:ABC-2 type transport system ATP-binding protein